MHPATDRSHYRLRPAQSKASLTTVCWRCTKFAAVNYSLILRLELDVAYALKTSLDWNSVQNIRKLRKSSNAVAVNAAVAIFLKAGHTRLNPKQQR